MVRNCWWSTLGKTRWYFEPQSFTCLNNHQHTITHCLSSCSLLLVCADVLIIKCLQVAVSSSFNINNKWQLPGRDGSKLISEELKSLSVNKRLKEDVLLCKSDIPVKRQMCLSQSEYAYAKQPDISNMADLHHTDYAHVSAFLKHRPQDV